MWLFLFLAIEAKRSLARVLVGELYIAISIVGPLGQVGNLDQDIALIDLHYDFL